MDTDTPEWAAADLPKLFSRIKSEISPKHETKGFNHGLKMIKWNRVKFTPYSAEACKKKWNSVMEKMRKFRNLRELVEEAEGGLTKVNVFKPIDGDMAMETSKWEAADLNKLFSRIKSEISPKDEMKAFHNALKTIDWYKVAFTDHSAPNCKKKFNAVMRQVRKYRNLRELVEEAEGGLTNVNKDAVLPKRPGPPTTLFYTDHFAQFKEENPNLSNKKLFILITKNYKDLPANKKAQYVAKHKLLLEEYHRQVSNLRDQCHEASKDESGCEKRRPIGNTHSDSEDLDMDDSSTISDESECEEEEKEDEGLGDVGFDLL